MVVVFIETAKEARGIRRYSSREIQSHKKHGQQTAIWRQRSIIKLNRLAYTYVCMVQPLE